MKLPRVVLVHPRNADNLATIAQAMTTFALADLVLVSSQTHLDGMLTVLRNHRAPCDSTAVLEHLRRVDTLSEAIADCSFIVGTSMRIMPGRPRLTARELAQEATLRHDTSWALVFGAECNGLQNEHLEQCHALSYLPTSLEQPSLNLAQAVLVYAYELSNAPEGVSHGPTLADDSTLRQLRQALVNHLWAARLLRNKRSDQEPVAALMAPLIRGSLTKAEAADWHSMWGWPAKTR